MDARTPVSGSWSGSWVEGADESFFPITNLAYGAFVAQSGPSTAQPRLCVRIGDSLLDLGACAADLGHPDAGLLGTPTLNTFMAAGPETWGRVR
ncbi:MAG: fumarylacetoacetase, partial [Acidimicrobiales bacterium]